MIVDNKTDQFKQCICGYTPKSYSIGYGRTPYSMSCKCGKQIIDAKCKITGNPSNLIDYWNSHLCKMTVNEIREEADDYRKEKERRRYPYYESITMYWEKGEGEYEVKRAN